MAERLALTLAEWSGALRWGDLRADHQAAVRLWLLDTLGVILAAVHEPAGRAVLAVAARQGGRPEASIAGQAGRLPAAWAALAHGTLAHALDFDDTLPAPVVHPGSLVVPTALAVGEGAGTDGAAVLAAIAAGYELAARLGAPAGRQLHARGFHASGVVGPLVAAAVAAKLAGLSPRQSAEAMGLAGSMAGGLLEFLADGSWSKRLHPGWAGHGGVVASQLAAAGFPGPVSVVEGHHGLYAAFLGGAEADDLAAVTRDLGRVWASRAVLAKLYPCAHVIHPFLDAALALRSQHALAPGAIATVRCQVAPWQIPIVCEPRASRIAPETEYQARASLPFALAAALVDGRVDLDTFGEGAIRRPDLLAMAARVSHAEAADVAHDFAGAVALQTHDGRTLAAGTTGHGAVAAERLLAKFEATAGRVLPGPAVARLAAAVDALPSGTPGGLMALCRI